jgi:hypothetical protein
MKLPRFSLKTLLIVATALALWFSTFASYRGAEDVRGFVMLAVAVAAGAAACCSKGGRRAFWGGLCASLLIMGSRSQFVSFAPRLTWLFQITMDLSGYLSSDPMQRKHLMESIQAMHFGVWLVIAMMIGLLCAYIHRQSRAPE